MYCCIFHISLSAADASLQMMLGMQEGGRGVWFFERSWTTVKWHQAALGECQFYLQPTSDSLAVPLFTDQIPYLFIDQAFW